MPTDALSKEIFDAIKPPRSDWQKSGTKSVLALLVGSAASLFEAGKLLKLYTPDMAPRWEPSRLFEDFHNSVDDDWSIQWSKQELVVWSVGYYLNKAQLNIAAALDALVNTWLAHRRGIDLSQDRLKADEEGLFFEFLPTRLFILRGDVEQTIVKRIDALRNAFQDYVNTNTARELIKDFSNQHVGQNIWPSLSTLYITLWPSLKEEECVATVFGRANAFKHHVSGHRLGREGVDHHIEWLVTVKALRCVGELWRTMVSDCETNEIKKEKR